MLKVLFVLEIFTFLFWVDKKDRVISKFRRHTLDNT